MAAAETSKERAFDYVGTIDAGLCCCVCHDPFDDPVLLECGHSFCRVCVDNWLATQLTCPECRSSVRGGARRPTVLALKRLVDDLPVRCPSTGCGAEVTKGNLDGHLQTCEFVEVECPACSSLVKKTDISATALQSESELKAKVAALTEEVRQAKALQRDLDRVYIQREHFDHGYNYGREPESIVSLTRFLSQNLQNALPYNIERARLFNCVQRCYQVWETRSPCNVIMVLTTALATNWFTRNQEQSIKDWIRYTSESVSKDPETSSIASF